MSRDYLQFASLTIAAAASTAMASCAGGCSSCQTLEECTRASCSAYMPPGTVYNPSVCKRQGFGSAGPGPSGNLFNDPSNGGGCSETAEVVISLICGCVGSICLGLVPCFLLFKRQEKNYMATFLSEAGTEVGRARGTLERKEVRVSRHQNRINRSYLFHVKYQAVGSNLGIANNVAAQSQLRMKDTFNKYVEGDVLEVAYRVGNPREHLLVDDAQLAMEGGVCTCDSLLCSGGLVIVGLAILVFAVAYAGCWMGILSMVCGVACCAAVGQFAALKCYLGIANSDASVHVEPILVDQPVSAQIINVALQPASN